MPKIERDERITTDNTMLQKIAEILGVSLEDIKSATPIMMSFHNCPYSNNGQVSGSTTNNTDMNMLEMLKLQLQQKDEQIKELLVLLNKFKSER